MRRVKEFYDRYERYVTSFALVAGFIFDYFTLNRIDFFLDNLFILLYLLLVGAGILVINLFEAGRLKSKFIENIYEFLPTIMQFAFGGLFSAFVVFYSKSASLFTSGAFVLILLALLIGNEFFKKRYLKLVFQIGIYFVALFSFSIYFLPVLIKQMGTLIFLLSGVISLVLISLFVLVIAFLVPERYRESRNYLAVTIISLYFGINLLYFTNIIPPIPLSLKMGDIFHFVERQVDGNYLITGEKNSWLEKLSLSPDIHIMSGETVYVFSSVFAPTDLNINIVHDWQYFDEERGKWVSASKVSFPIKGGRNEGYRGFSKKGNVVEGKWRVDIKTERDQVIGRVRFDIVIENSTRELETKVI